MFILARGKQLKFMYRVTLTDTIVEGTASRQLLFCLLK
ncbi:MAG: hypothetical protein K0Q73_5732 [Paenibacillus sp.]|jgi:hypothetical protein|nr:hypothetical protein [Paenibacillus sp.]